MKLRNRTKNSAEDLLQSRAAPVLMSTDPPLPPVSKAQQRKNKKSKNQSNRLKRLKTRPAEYKEFRIQESARLFEHRKNRTEEQKARDRDAARIRMQNMRQRRKDEGSAQGATKKKTRSEVTEQREKWREHQRKYRALFSTQKKRRVNEKQRQCYAYKRKASSHSTPTSDELTPPRTNDAQRKALSHSWKVAPKCTETFGSRHGKGPCDGEIGVLKKSATMADAHDLYKYGRDFLTLPKDEEDSHTHTKQTFFLMREGEVPRDTRAERASNIKPVPQTRMMHSFVGVSPNVVAARERSCFCDGCLVGDLGSCSAAHFARQLNTFSLMTGRKMKEQSKLSDQTGATKDATTVGSCEADCGELASAGQSAGTSCPELHSQPSTDRCELAAGPSSTPEMQLEEGTTITCSDSNDSTDDHGETDECSPAVPTVGDFVRVWVLRLGKNKSTDEIFVAKVVGMNADRFHVSYMDQRGSLFTWPPGEECIYTYTPRRISSINSNLLSLLPWAPEFFSNSFEALDS